MALFRNITIPLLVLALAACAKEKPRASSPQPSGSQNSASPAVEVMPVASFRRAVSIVKETTLSCEGAPCPATVGLFLAADIAGGFSPTDSVAACSAVLVGPDLALTNSHCIPSAVKLLPDLCAERIRVVLPAAAGQPEESLACARLLGASERATNVSPDLALLRLAVKSKRAAAPISRAGVENGATLRSVKVNPDLKNLRGTVRTESCVSAAESYRMPIYHDAASPALVLADCAAVPGNSGSPLFDTEGRVVALMQAALPLSETSLRDWAAHLENKEAGIASLALATQLHCLKAGLDAAAPEWSWSEACGTVTEQDVALARPRIRLALPSLEAEVSAALSPFLSQAPALRLARAELETRPLRRKEQLRPACFLEGALPETAELAFPFISLELRFNRFLQPARPAILLTAPERRQYKFNATKTDTDNFLELQPLGEGETFRLDPCPPGEPGNT